jgi:amino acid adenylation domain-containing protein
MTQQKPDNVYVLSPLQQGLLFHSLLAPDAGLYIEQTVLTLSGAVDTAALLQAVRYTAARHGALRTTFHWKDLDKPLQVVRREVTVPVEAHDWTARSGEPAAASRERLESFLAADRRRGFDLSTPPLFRVSVIRLDAAASLLIWTYHHILLDGWSGNILDGETLAAYAAILAGRTPDGPPVRQFGDYIHWLRGRDAGAAEAFWRARMAGFTAPTPLGPNPPGPPLPSPSQPPGEGGDLHGQRELSLSPVATAGLRAFARRHQLTLNTLVQGAWALLLHAYSGEQDVVFGATVSGRPAEIPGVESIVGLFINSLPVRVRIPEEIGSGLVGWLREIQSAQMAAQPYEHASLADIQRWSSVPAGKPLFESLVVFENVPMDLHGTATVSETTLVSQRSVLLTHYPLVLKVMPGESLAFQVTYQGRRFSAVMAVRLLAHLAALLTGLASEAPALPTPLTAAERHQLLWEWNDTAVDFPRERTLPELFAEVVRRQPEAVAVELDGVRWTYGELDARTDRLAGALRRLGVGADGPEIRVGLAAEETPALVAGMLGILKAGGVYVPLDSTYPEERLERMIAAAELRVLVAAEHAPTAWPEDRPVVVMSELGEAEEIGPIGPIGRMPPTRPENLAYILFTSGSSGQPKGVGVPHRAIARLVLGSGFARLGPAARIAQVSNTAFDAATFEVWGALLTGGTVVGIPRNVVLAPAAFAERLRSERISTLFLTTALFHLMARETPDAFRGLTDLLVGGEVVDPRAMAAVLHGGAPARLANIYGPTESTTYALTWPVDQVDTGAVPIGRPIANTRGYVLDRAMRPVPAGVTGELWLGGDGLARGYLGFPERTAESFRPDPFAAEPGGRLYCTGDLVRRRPDGAVEYLRRNDLQVKIRGFRIEPGEVEVALIALPAVTAAAVVTHEESPGERRLVAYVVPAGGGGWEDAAEADLIADIRRDLARKLPAYMVPSAFTLLPALPLTANGKIDRAALAALAVAPQAAEGARRGFVAPRTPIEELLAGTWSAVLGVEQVGIHDDFLELGGHSLLATQLLSRVREAFRVELPLASLFEEATVAGQASRVAAALLAKDGTDSAAPPLVPVGYGDEAPLSFAQQRLWILDRFDPGMPAYNIPLAVSLTGPVRPGALRGALAAVVARHEALRTHFAVTAAGPVQRIEPAGEPALPWIDLTGLPAAVVEAELELRLALLGIERFDLQRGPLLRAALFSTSSEAHTLLLNVHHIIADGWSLGILFREMAACYAAACEGTEAALPPLPIQYADFAIWQRGWLQGPVLERQLAFWRERLAGLPAGSPLTADRPRPPLQTFNGALTPVAFPSDLAAAAHRFARAERVTPFMALLAVFAELLGRASGWEDLAIGTPVANRNRLETEGLIGFFVNTLVLRADVGPESGSEPTVRRLLARMREVTLAATAHQDLPFEKLVEELRPERSLAFSPFFQVFFTLETAAPAPELGGLTPDLAGVETGAAKFDLTLSLTRRDERIGGAVEYNTDLFDRTTAARLGGHLLTLLAGFVAHPERPAASLPLLAEGEQQQILCEWNDTASETGEETLPALFARQAARTPEAVALVSGTRELTYQELARRAAGLADWLRRAAVAPEVPVGVFLDRGPALVTALLGVLAAGGAYVPLDPAYPRERLAATLDDCRAPWIVTREELAGRLPAGAARLVLLDGEGEVAEPHATDPTHQTDLSAAVPIDPRNLAYLIYTSGSTGKPKGVAIEHRSAAALLAWTREVFPAADLAAVFASTSVCFDLSVFEIFAPLTRGGTVVLAENALDFAALRHPRGVTLVNTVPSAAAELLRAGAFPPTLRTLNLAGEPIPAALAAQLALLPGRVLNLYGPSETTTYSSFSPVSGVGRQPPIGRPIAGTGILLLDRRLQPAAIGVPGEVYIAGAGLARGYFGNPELTAVSFLPHPFGNESGSRVYRTGDLARALPDGRLEFLGRRDHQVKVRGFRIETGEIETALARQPAVAESVVVVRTDAGTPQLVAYAVPRAGLASPGVSTLAAELRAALRQRLPEFMIPAAIVELAALPRTPTGKVDRAALPPPGETLSPTMPGPAAAPRTALEQAIAAAVRAVMNVERVGVNDNFFDLGGSSLLLVRLAARLEEQLGRPVQPLDLFRAPSVAALARFLSETGETGETGEAAQAEETAAPAPVERHQARDRRREMRRAAAAAGDLPE